MNDVKMTKDDYINFLMKDPSLDSNAVKYISSIMTNDNIDISIDDLKKYNNDQLAVIDAVFASDSPKNLDDEEKSLFLNNDFNSTQLNILYQGMCQGVSKDDIKLLENPAIPYGILNYIVQGLIKGYPMLKYSSGYSIGQVYEIFNGFSNGLTEEQISTIDDINEEELLSIAIAALLSNKRVIKIKDENDKLYLIIK